MVSMSGEGGFKLMYILRKNTKLEKKRWPTGETQTDTVTFWKRLRNREKDHETESQKMEILVSGEDDTSLVFYSLLLNFPHFKFGMRQSLV